VRDRPRALAVLLAVFLAGCLVGGAGSFVWLRKAAATAGSRPAGRGQERQKLKEVLQLSPEQEAQFTAILNESRKRLAEVQREHEPKIESIRNETNSKLNAILNPEQQRKFAEFRREMRSRRRPPGAREGAGPQPPR